MDTIWNNLFEKPEGSGVDKTKEEEEQEWSTKGDFRLMVKIIRVETMCLHLARAKVLTAISHFGRWP
jgi:hypothetical protein